MISLEKLKNGNVRLTAKKPGLLKQYASEITPLNLEDYIGEFEDDHDWFQFVEGIQAPILLAIAYGDNEEHYVNDYYVPCDKNFDLWWFSDPTGSIENIWEYLAEVGSIELEKTTSNDAKLSDNVLTEYIETLENTVKVLKSMTLEEFKETLNLESHDDNLSITRNKKRLFVFEVCKKDIGRIKNILANYTSSDNKFTIYGYNGSICEISHNGKLSKKMKSLIRESVKKEISEDVDVIFKEEK